MNNCEKANLSKYATVKRMAEIYKEIYSEAALRKLILNGSKNGIDKCIRRIGGKIIINTEAFDNWIEEHTCANKN
jgi:hypothetical protein